MTLLGFNFTQQQVIDYVKSNWKPGKKELIYVSFFLVVFILTELYGNSPLPTASADPSNPTAIIVPDQTLVTLRSFTINAIQVFSALLITYLYFAKSERKPSTALKWGVAYSAPVALISLVFWLSNIGMRNVAQAVISDILYLPYTFFWGLLLAGGFYLFLVYRPKLNFIIVSYILLLVCYIVFSAAAYGLGAGFTWVFTDSLIAISLAGLFLAIKKQISFPFPTVLLYGGIGLGFMIIMWVSDLVYLDFVPYYVEFLAFLVTGFALYFLMKQNILGLGDNMTVPPPPPPPETTM